MIKKFLDKFFKPIDINVWCTKVELVIIGKNKVHKFIIRDVTITTDDGEVKIVINDGAEVIE